MPQVLRTEPAQRPTVVTMTAGANDFLPAGSRVALVDLYAASEGHESSFVLVNRPGGFDVHSTNVGHTIIAAEFAKVWQGLQ